MARVAEELVGNVVRVLEAVEHVTNERDLSTLSELVTSGFGTRVQLLNPRVVGSGAAMTDVVLEDNDVGVWDLVGIGGR